MKNAILDFGAVGDDATNNDAAAAAAVAYINATGGFVFWPQGAYRFDSPIPTITSRGGGFLGDGPGSQYPFHNHGPAGSSYGTIFRRNFTSDLITTDRTSNNFIIRDIGFWPVCFTTAGYEIHDRGLGTLIENVNGCYTNGVVKFGGGANGARAHRVRAFGIWGGGGITCRGTSPNIADWAQGITIDDFGYYNPLTADPTGARAKGAWAANTSYAQHDLVTANGRIWQATNAGTSLNVGPGPVTPAYAFAGAPTTVFVADNDINWKMIGSSSGANINIDSNSVVINIINSQLSGTGFWGLILQNTLLSGIVPQSIKVVNSLIDHPLSDCVFLVYGYCITFTDCDLRYSAQGRGITGDPRFTGNLYIKGGHVWGNALDGIIVPGKPDVHASIIGARVNANGAKALNTYAGIFVPPNTTRVQIADCHMGGDPSGVGTQKYGLQIGGGCDNFIVTGNIALGNGTAGYSNSSGTGATKIVADNI